MTQQTLFATDQTRFESWQEFHAANPRVWDLFRKLAIEAHTVCATVGARMIGGRIRWSETVETTDADYKINDHHWPYYARLLAGTDRRFEKYFTFKDERFDTTIGAIVEFHNGLNNGNT